MSKEKREEREGLWERLGEKISKFFSEKKLAKMNEKELIALDGRLLDAMRKVLAECSSKATRIANLALRRRARDLWSKLDRSVMTYIRELMTEAEAIPSGHAPVFEEKGFFRKYRYRGEIKPHKSILTKVVVIDLLLISEIEALSSALSDLEKNVMLDADVAPTLLAKITDDLIRIRDLMAKRKEMSLRPVDAATIYRGLRDEYAWRFDRLLKHLMEDEIAELKSTVKHVMSGEVTPKMDKVIVERLSESVLKIGREASKAYGGLMSLPDLYIRLHEEGVDIGPQELSFVIRSLASSGLVKLREEQDKAYVDFLIDLTEDKLKVLNMLKERGLKKITLSEAVKELGWTAERVRQVMGALEKDGIIAKTESFMEEPCFYLKTPLSEGQGQA